MVNNDAVFIDEGDGEQRCYRIAIVARGGRLLWANLLLNNYSACRLYWKHFSTAQRQREGWMVPFTLRAST